MQLVERDRWSIRDLRAGILDWLGIVVLEKKRERRRMDVGDGLISVAANRFGISMRWKVPWSLTRRSWCDNRTQGQPCRLEG